MAALSGFLGTVALLLVCIGLYGLMSYAAAQRTMRESLLLVLAGAAIGLPAAFLTSRLIASRLFAVKPGDPPTLVAEVLAMLVVAAAASDARNAGIHESAPPG